MRFEFTLGGLAGAVDVTLVPNEHPEALGCRPTGLGFRVCTATSALRDAVTWPRWAGSRSSAQRMASAVARSFEMDPYEPLGILPHPFCWFGFAPTLFDAPSRGMLDDMEWAAHSFLSFIGGPHEACAILGFSWGFVVREQAIAVEEVAPLTPETWDAHLPLLRREHPAWRFTSGYQPLRDLALLVPGSRY